MKLPFVRRTTADELRSQLAHAERGAAALAASVEVKNGEVVRLTDDLNNARLAREALKAAYEITNSRARRAEESSAELKTYLRTVPALPDTGETSVDEPQREPENRDYAFTLLNLVLPQFADLIARNGGVLPEDNYEALSIYVNGASRHGLTEAEVEDLRVRHNLPAPIFQRAKDFASRPLPASAA
ncbi:hypothetical protein OHA69_41060 [Streptomyces anulatus]|uniref:hypothetical protein n=1 Tax=Streptomyces anulatus TaxID=1892 RepID=UPI00224D87F3|nr:hypothetical protein [Streptomyces anulatus]MCX4523982.1 hypothetical protein [Streptomyces anulatus]WSU78997.1 hypothetical protein OG499_39200 [Streptomyces anulatus]